MPSIAGMISKRPDEKFSKLLDNMLESMMHENFYVKSSYINMTKGYYIGGISIKNSFSDCMPIYNDSGDVIFFIAGECLLSSEVISNLGNSQIVDSNTARILVLLYEKFGIEFINYIDGWYSIVIIDERSQNLYLVNDHFGIRKLYYHSDDNGFYFASEAKALLSVFPELREISSQGIAQYLCYDCILENRTIFSKIKLLPSGTLLTFKNNSIEECTYFDPTRFENEPKLDTNSFFREFTETFKKIFPKYLRGDEIVISVTGGLDTRLILSCLPPNTSNLKALTHGGLYGDCVDLRIGKEISKFCGLDHYTLRHDQDYFTKYPELVSRSVYLTDGLSDSTWADLPYFNNMARAIAPIKLSGVYGSQVLGRVRAALRNRFPDFKLIEKDFVKHIYDTKDDLSHYENENKLSYLLKRELPWYWSRSMIPQLFSMTVRSPFLDKELIRLLYRAPTTGYDGSKIEVQSILKNNPSLLDVQTNRGVGGKNNFLVSAIKNKFYDLRYIGEKTLNWPRLPYSLHHPISIVDAKILSPLSIDRMFLGFEYYRHYNLWFRKELSPYIKEMLLDDRTLNRPYWEKRYLETIVNRHINGHGRYLSEINKVLTIELIHRNFIENSYPPITN